MSPHTCGCPLGEHTVSSGDAECVGCGARLSLLSMSWDGLCPVCWCIREQEACPMCAPPDED